MWRKIFTRLSILSLVLCVATIGWWMRTRGSVDQLTYQRDDIELLRLAGGNGKIVVTHTLYDPAKPRLGSGQLHWDSATEFPPDSSGDTHFASMGFNYLSQPRSNGGRDSTLILPLWMLAAGFAILPICWTGGKLRRKKKPA